MLENRGLLAPPQFYRKILRIALPVCLQQLLNQGAGFIDTLMVSQIGYVSAVAVAMWLTRGEERT